jgi:hypothetical protein
MRQLHTINTPGQKITGLKLKFEVESMVGYLQQFGSTCGYKATSGREKRASAFQTKR